MLFFERYPLKHLFYNIHEKNNIPVFTLFIKVNTGMKAYFPNDTEYGILAHR